MKEATGQDIPLYEILGRLAEKGMDASSSSMKVQTTFDGTRTDSGLRGEIRNISSDNFTGIPDIWRTGRHDPGTL